MSTTTISFGPPPRDDLAEWSDAPLSTLDPGPIPPFTAPSPPAQVINVGGQDVLVRVTAGAGSARHAAVYIHGLDGMSQNWDRLTAALSPWSVGVAPDLPGEGLTPPPPGGRYSLNAEADLCAAVIRRGCGGPVHLVGNSRGGIVATLLAARFPELIRTLTLIAPAVPDLRVTRDRGADVRLGAVLLPGIRGMLARQLGRVTPGAWADRLADTCFGEPERLTADDIAAAAAAFAQRGRLPWAAGVPVDALRSLLRAQLRPWRWSFAAAARAVACPALVVWGTRDRLVDARLARRTARQFDDGRLLMIPRAGHVCHMERPAEVARAMLALWCDHADCGPTGAPGRAGHHGVGFWRRDHD